MWKFHRVPGHFPLFFQKKNNKLCLKCILSLFKPDPSVEFSTLFLTGSLILSVTFCFKAFSRVLSEAKKGPKINFEPYKITNLVHKDHFPVSRTQVILKPNFKVPLSQNKTWKNYILVIRKAEIHFIIIKKTMIFDTLSKFIDNGV